MNRIPNWFAAALIFVSSGAMAKDVEVKGLALNQEISQDPFDPAWAKASSAWIPLMPQTIAPPGGGGGVKRVRVRSIRTEQEILFRLDWADANVDNYPSKSEGFPDAVALEFPANPATWPSPFMGDRKNPVVIWRWSASAQKDLDTGYQSASLYRPRKTADLYANAGDVTFRTGEGAGNILSNRRRQSPIENLAARGFGTLTVQGDQPVKGRGVWRKGRWYVVFRRDIRGTPPFWHGNRVPFAAGVWDGSKRERNGMKSVSIWQTLALPGSGRRKKGTAVEEGRRVYQRFGCAVCHGDDAKGGIKNPNAQTNPMPGLDKVREGFTKEELLQVVFDGREPVRADPAGMPPPFKMNGWKVVMDQKEGDALADYLFSLMKEGDEEEW